MKDSQRAVTDIVRARPRSNTSKKTSPTNKEERTNSTETTASSSGTLSTTIQEKVLSEPLKIIREVDGNGKEYFFVSLVFEMKSFVVLRNEYR